MPPSTQPAPAILNPGYGVSAAASIVLKNPLIQNFKQRFEMHKCSSAHNILKSPSSFVNNRISLSPIQNSLIKNLHHQQQQQQHKDKSNIACNECIDEMNSSCEDIENKKKTNYVAFNSQLVQNISLTDSFKPPISMTSMSSVANTSEVAYRNTSSYVLLNKDNNQQFKSPINLNTSRSSRPSSQSKTPKTIKKRGQLMNICSQEKNKQVFGTPDYLSPELLLAEEHDESVDWWALGVCLYEFLVGITPFADETAQLIFDNILNRNIEWPENDEALSPQAMDAIMRLLSRRPADRMRMKKIKQHDLFKQVNWNNLLNEKAPFLPQPDHNMDTCYFDTRNEIQSIKMSMNNLK